MKKNISIILLLSILFSFVTPINIEASGFIKEIDAKFDLIRIQIDDRYINNKEVFTYENEIWVSVKDLARGLDMGIKHSKDKRTIYLDSKGKLNKNIDSSKALNSYQTGYEIDAKERRIEGLKEEISKMEKSWKHEKDEKPFEDAKVRNIKVQFGDSHVYLDGKKLDIEPIIYKDEIYVPVDSLSRYLYINPYYNAKRSVLEIDANGILLDKKYYNNLDSLTTMRNNKKHLLDIQLAQLEKRKSVIMNLDIPYEKIKTTRDLKNYLNRYLNSLEGIPTKIDIDNPPENWMYIDISFPKSRMNDWYKLQQQDVEDWIWNIYAAILSLYDEDTVISGAIKNPYYSKKSNSPYAKYVTFRTENKYLYFDFSNSRLKRDKNTKTIDLIEHLEKNLNRYNSVEFGYSAEINGNNIDLIIYSNSNNPYFWSSYTKTNYFKRLRWEIRRIYPNATIDGKLVFPYGNKEPIKFSIKGDNIKR